MIAGIAQSRITGISLSSVSTEEQQGGLPDVPAIGKTSQRREAPPALDHPAGARGLAQSSPEIAVEGAQLVCRILPPAENAKEMRTGLPSGPEQSSTTPSAVGVISSSPNALGEKAASRACQ